MEYRHKDLKEGDIFEIGAAKIKILHTPGHTPSCNRGIRCLRSNGGL